MGQLFSNERQLLPKDLFDLASLQIVCDKITAYMITNTSQQKAWIEKKDRKLCRNIMTKGLNSQNKLITNLCKAACLIQTFDIITQSSLLIKNSACELIAGKMKNNKENEQVVLKHIANLLWCNKKFDLQFLKEFRDIIKRLITEKRQVAILRDCLKNSDIDKHLKELISTYENPSEDFRQNYVKSVLGRQPSEKYKTFLSETNNTVLSDNTLPSRIFELKVKRTVNSLEGDHDDSYFERNENLLFSDRIDESIYVYNSSRSEKTVRSLNKKCEKMLYSFEKNDGYSQEDYQVSEEVPINEDILNEKVLRNLANLEKLRLGMGERLPMIPSVFETSCDGTENESCVLNEEFRNSLDQTNDKEPDFIHEKSMEIALSKDPMDRSFEGDVLNKTQDRTLMGESNYNVRSIPLRNRTLNLDMSSKSPSLLLKGQKTTKKIKPCTVKKTSSSAKKESTSSSLIKKDFSKVSSASKLCSFNDSKVAESPFTSKHLSELQLSKRIFNKNENKQMWKKKLDFGLA